MIRKISKLLLWLVALALVALLVLGYTQTRGRAKYAILPHLTSISITQEEGDDFVEEQDVVKYLPFDIADTTFTDVAPAKVESLLATHIPYLQDINAYISPTIGQLNIQLTSRTPILRYMQGGVWHFLDREGKTMPWKYGAISYVPISVGNITDSTLTNLLYPLALFLHQHSEWQYFFGMIEVVSERRLHLYPRVGDYVFELIGADNLEENIGKIPIFYQEIVPQVGANKYKLIKLSYEGQIVCKYRH